MSVCIECGKESMFVVDFHSALRMSQPYTICKSCLGADRRWSCATCKTEFLGKRDQGVWSVTYPACPTCGKDSAKKSIAVPLPQEYTGYPSVITLWRTTLDEQVIRAELMKSIPAKQAAEAQAKADVQADAEAAAKEAAELAALPTAWKADYLGGHPDAATAQSVMVGHCTSGIRVFSRETNRLLFGIPWPFVARINHVLAPKGKPVDQGQLFMAAYGSTGRGGAVTDWANAALAVRGLFDRDKHFVSITLRTQDGFEGSVGFEAKEGEVMASALTAERLRHGQNAPPPAQAAVPAPAGGDVMAKLKELASLKEAGIITADEFTAKKTELLARL